ncbi:hypothetical protein ACT29H_12740 [Thermophagus sp. OGC60D27]|uniref:hypothetical protein n=1 Tax=Thermophagus sp. OGC60D27 TaxID=3458415 RepID=UPI004037B295
MGLVVDVLLYFFGGKSGEVGEFFDGYELMGLFPQALANIVQDSVAGFLTFAGDALDVLGVDANSFGLHLLYGCLFNNKSGSNTLSILEIYRIYTDVVLSVCKYVSVKIIKKETLQDSFLIGSQVSRDDLK